MKIKHFTIAITFLVAITVSNHAFGQVSKDTVDRVRKNIIRYNLSGAMLFGVDKYIVLGYERVVGPHQSFSVNLGRASLPRLLAISSPSVDLKKETKRSGFNVSVDYRFYLAKENKFRVPRGVYIGPYYSFIQFKNEVNWSYMKDGGQSNVTSKTDFKINTIGFELGYQFIFWKKWSLDLVMIGPGMGFYNYKVSFDGNLTQETQEKLFDVLEQALEQKFPGINYVFSDEHIAADGAMRTNAFGYRYLVQIGFHF